MGPADCNFQVWKGFKLRPRMWQACVCLVFGLWDAGVSKLSGECRAAVFRPFGAYNVLEVCVCVNL